MGNYINTKFNVVDREWRYPYAQALARHDEWKQQRVLIVQYEDRPDEIERCHRLMRTNEAYARHWNYDYRFHKRCEWTDQVAPYWIKVFLVASALDNYDYVVWVDSDAVIYAHETPIQAFFLAPEVRFVGCEDSPYGISFFMSGIFMTRGRKDIEMERLFKDWKAGYDTQAWTKSKTTGKWQTWGFWAGPKYEQGYFVKSIYSTYRASIRLLSYAWFHEVELDTSESQCRFAYHFRGTYKETIPLFIPPPSAIVDETLANVVDTDVLTNDTQIHEHCGDTD